MARMTALSRAVRRLIVVSALMVWGLTMLVGSAFAQEGPKTHTVQAGETLTEIAAQYGVTVQALIEANALRDADVIYAGMELLIPTVGTTETEATGAPSAPATDGGSTYVVQPGDTVDTIARLLNVDPQALIDANFGPGDDPSALFAGQVLTIPAGAPPYPGNPPSTAPAGQEGTGGGGLREDQSYTVQRGDVLDAIAQQFDVALESIAYANGLDQPYVIMPGQVLFIPGDAPPYSVVPPAPGQPGYTGPVAATTQDGQGGGGLGEGEPYTVQPGDTLDTLAQAFDVAIESIVYANGLERPYVIMPGQVLLIPADAPPYGVVPPAPGQPVFSGVGLREGQGGGSATAGEIQRGERGAYIVQEGDTILSIVFALDLDLLEFLRANPRLLNAVELTPGTELVIP